MKKLLTFLILLLSINTVRPIKIESFDNVNWHNDLMETIREPHMTIENRMNAVTTALVNGAKAEGPDNDYAPVREAIRRGHLCLIEVFLEAGLPIDLVIDGYTIQDHLQRAHKMTYYFHYLGYLQTGATRIFLPPPYNSSPRLQEQMMLLTRTVLSLGIKVKDILKFITPQDFHLAFSYLLDRRLISPHKTIGNTSLANYATSYNANNILKILLARGAHFAYPAHRSLLDTANNLETIQVLMENGAYGLTPHEQLPLGLTTCLYDQFLPCDPRAITRRNPSDDELRRLQKSYVTNFRRTALLLRAYLRQNHLANYLPDITGCLYQSYSQHYDREHQFARLILEYSQGIPIQKYKAPAPVKATTLIHVPKKSAKRRYADMQAADQQPAVGAAGAAGAHLSASAQSEIANRARR